MPILTPGLAPFLLGQTKVTLIAGEPVAQALNPYFVGLERHILWVGAAGWFFWFVFYGCLFFRDHPCIPLRGGKYHFSQLTFFHTGPEPASPPRSMIRP